MSDAPKNPAALATVQTAAVRRTGIAPFFVVSAAMEIGAGIALLAAPDLAIRLIFGASGTGAAVALGRLAGAALLSLGGRAGWRATTASAPHRARSSAGC